jgi:hypothetical protein
LLQGSGQPGIVVTLTHDRHRHAGGFAQFFSLVTPATFAGRSTEIRANCGNGFITSQGNYSAPQIVPNPTSSR